MLKIRLFIFISGLFISSLVFCQQPVLSKLKVFIDCSGTWCDMQFIRSEINIVDFLLDNKAADLHVLVTNQPAGNGGSQYQLIFFGQHAFKNMTDTLRFNINPNATEVEHRDLLLQYLKTGLVPFISKTTAVKNITIGLKAEETEGKELSADSITTDPWRAWVMRIGVNGNMNADANYKNTSYSGNFSANRITDDIKIGMGFYYSRNKAVFEYEDNGSAEQFVVNNHNWSINHYLVKSISQHWSWAWEVKLSQNSFSNSKSRLFLSPALEYNIFPYKQVNNKLFTLSYGLTVRKNHYYDSTIYNKTKEVLYGHKATAYLSLNQKWGMTYAGLSYHNYFHDWSFFNLGVDLYANVRVTGGLSVFIMAFGGITRDQVFLVKGNASPEEVLARRRQLASGYNYYSTIGISYRFGSRLNNVVNPRFDRSSSINDD